MRIKINLKKLDKSFYIDSDGYISSPGVGKYIPVFYFNKTYHKNFVGWLNENPVINDENNYWHIKTINYYPEKSQRTKVYYICG